MVFAFTFSLVTCTFHFQVVDAGTKKAQLKEKGKKAAGNPRAYAAGRKWKDMPEKGKVLTAMIKGENGDKPTFVETDTEEELTLDRIDVRVPKGTAVYGFLKHENGEPVTYTGGRVANAPYPRQVKRATQIHQHFTPLFI